MTTAPTSDANFEVRRPLTAVFVDIVGSTPLSILMEGEEYAEMIAEYRRIASAAAADHDGFIPRDEGDGRFIWFGWPSARRDDAQRAVAMSLDLMDAMAPLSQRVEAETGRPVSLRVGIHTGPAVITFPGDATKPDVSSATVNFAAKVQQAADPDTVLITEATMAALVQPFQVEPHGNVSIDELPGGIDVYRVVGRPAAPVALGPFVGRRAELGRLTSAWQIAAAGGSSAMLVSGEAGLGKSRLVQELRHEAGWPITAEIQGDVDHTSHPFGAVHGALRTLIGDHAQPSDLETLGLDPAVGEDVLRAAGLRPLDGRRADAIAGAVALIRSAAETTPLLLVVDDAQWLDPSTQEIVARLIEGECRGLMILMTSRRPLSSEWPAVDTIELKGLGPAEAHELLAEIDSDGDDGQRVAELIERAAGNPFFLVWLSRTNEPETYQGIRRLLRPRSGVPVVVQQAVRSQIDGAGVDDDITTMAAVIGMEFDTDLLADTLDTDVKHIGPDLQRLASHDIIRPTDGSPVRYRFTHSLVRDLAYDLLLANACQQRHCRVADVLEWRGSDDHATIGLHHDRGGRPVEASRSKLRAAHQCRRSNAYREGSELLERVLELSAEDAVDLPVEIEVEARELHATLAAAVDPDSYAAGSSARSGVLDMLDPDEEIRRVVMAKTRDWAAAMMTADLATSIRLLYEVRRTGQRSFPEIMVCNTNARGTHAAYRGRYAHAERLLVASTDEMAARGIDTWLEDHWGTPDDPMALAYSYAPPVLWQRGRHRTAIGVLDRAWRRAEAVPGGAHTMAHVGSNAAVYWELAGDGRRAVQIGEQIVEIGTELGLDFWALNGAMHVRLGQALIEPNADLLDQCAADAALLEAFAPMAAGRVHLQIAGHALAIDDAARALVALDAVRASSQRTGMQYLDAEELRLRAQHAGNDAAAAEELLRRAADLASRQGARRYQLRALTDLAARSQDPADAGALDEAVRAIPERDGDPDVDRAILVLSNTSA